MSRALAAPQVTGWTWTCLPCNSTWIGSAVDHRCAHRKDYCRDYWIQRLRWVPALQATTVEERAAIVDEPMTRTRVAQLLGPSWLVAVGGV